MNRDINIIFSQAMLSDVLKEVKRIDPTIQPNVETDVYIELSSGSGKERWFTFKFKDFYWENYVDNAYEGKAKAWCAWIEKQRRIKHEAIHIMGVEDTKIEAIIDLFWGKEGGEVS